ncbi:polycystic kidney disease protein 1-like 2 [Oncorhynchus tshawytscha]|uniref:polycystic kidney disease protein 1-like 2 n=1 Tax=Oncorhynchus tshawytscha TaxID=74940 RepID=UPI000D09E521|nr:polycystic kidney disease protein 1-like 2 [Oncorhynchus tshawytscha]
MIDVPSSDVTLVLKIKPSKDITFQLFLGYKDDTNDKQYIAKTQMPHQSNTQDVSRTAELFATFAQNPVVVCFIGSIFVAYVLVVIWARGKDIQDTTKVKVTLLEDNDPLAEYRYMLNISTGHRRGASTSSQGESEPHHLADPDKPVFERGAVDTFLLTTPFSLGELQSIRLWHDNSVGHPACNLFFMRTAKDFRDGHIWFSVISRPPTSTFTCVQRVSCCFSLLLCTMLTSIMFWGIPTDPSEQTMDLGHIDFTWQQLMIGVQSSIIMFLTHLLLVSIFRNTRPRETKPGKPKAEVSKQGKTGSVSLTASVPKEGQRTHTRHSQARLLLYCILSGHKEDCYEEPHSTPGVRDEAWTTNSLLSLVEDVIRQQNRASGEFYTDASKKEGSLILSLEVANLQALRGRGDSADADEVLQLVRDQI